MTQTIGTIHDLTEVQRALLTPEDIARFYPEPGVYFNMPFDQYLDIRALNSGGIKRLGISETDYCQNSWMNVWGDIEEDDDTKAKRDGRAYHKRILEGHAAFYDAYAPAFSLEDTSDVLMTNKDMEQYLSRLGVKGYSGKKTEQLIAMVLDKNPAAKIKSHLEASYKQAHPGKEFLDEKTLRYIELINKMVQCHPDLKAWFAGGQPEVSVVFDYAGCRFKVRFDYMKIRYVCDLKTFANQRRRSITRAVEQAVESNGYWIQAALYLLGADAAQALIKAGAVHGYAGPAEWLADYTKTPVEEFRFAFLQKGNAPAVQPAIFDRQDRGYVEGVAEVHRAVDKFRRALKLYGTDKPWLYQAAPLRLAADNYLWRAG